MLMSHKRDDSIRNFEVNSTLYLRRGEGSDILSLSYFYDLLNTHNYLSISNYIKAKLHIWSLIFWYCVKMISTINRWMKNANVTNS